MNYWMFIYPVLPKLIVWVSLSELSAMEHFFTISSLRSTLKSIHFLKGWTLVALNTSMLCRVLAHACLCVSEILTILWTAALVRGLDCATDWKCTFVSRRSLTAIKKDVWLPKSLIKRTPLPNWQTKVGVSNSLHFWKKKKKILCSTSQGTALIAARSLA